MLCAWSHRRRESQNGCSNFVWKPTITGRRSRSRSGDTISWAFLWRKDWHWAVLPWMPSWTPCQWRLLSRRNSVRRVSSSVVLVRPSRNIPIWWRNIWEQSFLIVITSMRHLIVRCSAMAPSSISLRECVAQWSWAVISVSMPATPDSLSEPWLSPMMMLTFLTWRDVLLQCAMKTNFMQPLLRLSSRIMLK